MWAINRQINALGKCTQANEDIFVSECSAVNVHSMYFRRGEIMRDRELAVAAHVIIASLLQAWLTVMQKER